MAKKTRAAAIREQLDFPVIDADGHFVELAPLLNDEIVSYVEEAGGAELRETYLRSAAKPIDTSTVLRQRDGGRVADEWRAMPSWWGWQTRNTLDRATMHLPRLLHERLDDFGIDVAILYPSAALSFLDMADGDLAAVLCQAVNRYHARLFADYSDRLLVGALVPMSTPDIAIAGLDHAVNELGLKTAVIAGATRRPIPRIHRENPKLDSIAYRLDTYGLDSAYDYDPFWARCVELGVAPVSHSALQYHRVTRSISSYVFNHIGGLSASHESLCKSLFLGGVTNRFPRLQVGFLEGGVAWACSLYADLVGHWEKRNADEITQLDPANLDVAGVMAYVAKYGSDEMRARADDIAAHLSQPSGRPEVLDEFASVAISSVDDLRDRFVPHFYFGCEADDPLITWAFREDVNPAGARLRPIFGSDISHWDVPDMTEPVEESYELVEKGVLTEDQFRELVFVNPARLHAGVNPDFFAGTIVESAVAAELAAEGAAES
jgi:predicted TIM-barrel fold metal-dependent hydrolase